MKTIFKSIALIFMLLIFSTTVEARDVVKVDVNATTYVNVGSVITRITSGNPQIAVVKQVDSTLNGQRQDRLKSI